ncbi:OLC1v1001820C2 [Oldenlandia corymbosa var. corymbosa]|uniref:OLC1v1001820C2 n=1 Tax=Oldenlandia corymbosa var. corymbosa TaxID=529605 RepID=A0AAV1D6F2_OLDCO|nr:OLC1v1001820C2 [Oldenlandia corymbosa var. corymbosa]
MMEVSKFTQDVFWLGPFSVCQLAIEATPGHLSVHQGLPCFSAASSVECSLLAEVWLHFSNLRIWGKYSSKIFGEMKVNSCAMNFLQSKYSFRK